jgi:hypothetical protein
MIHTAMWLLTCAVAVYVTGIITGALFSLFSKDKDKEGAAIFGFIVAPFIIIAMLIVHALWPL